LHPRNSTSLITFEQEILNNKNIDILKSRAIIPVRANNIERIAKPALKEDSK